MMTCLHGCPASGQLVRLTTVHNSVCWLQMVGVNFLMLLKRQGIRGSILADEMGLGKTAQAICFLGMYDRL